MKKNVNKCKCIFAEKIAKEFMVQTPITSMGRNCCIIKRPALKARIQ